MILNWQVSLANYMMMRINEFQQIKSTGSIALFEQASQFATIYEGRTFQLYCNLECDNNQVGNSHIIYTVQGKRVRA